MIAGQSPGARARRVSRCVRKHAPEIEPGDAVGVCDQTPAAHSIFWPVAKNRGALAQLGEHLLCKQRVIGSIPIGSTTPPSRKKDRTAGRIQGCVVQSDREMRLLTSSREQ